MLKSLRVRSQIRARVYGGPLGEHVDTFVGVLRDEGYKSDPVSLDTVWTTMTAAKEAGHERQGAKANHDSWQ